AGFRFLCLRACGFKSRLPHWVTTTGMNSSTVPSLGSHLMGDDSGARLRLDYERVALAGIKRVDDAREARATTDPSILDAVDRLAAGGLATREGDAIVL